MNIFVQKFNFLKRILFSIFLILISVYIYCQTSYHLIYDTKHSQNFGAENILCTHKIISTSTENLIPVKLWDEKNMLAHIGGMGFRLAKLGLFDNAFDYMFMLAQHEIFGHGARYREMGYTNSSYALNLPFPYGSGSGFAKSGNPESGRIFSETEQITKVIGGNEANMVLSESLSSRILLADNMHYRDALLYLLTKNNLLAYVWYDKYKFNGTFSSGDIATYVFDINNQNASSGKYYTLDKLAKQSLISLLNPMQFYAAYSIGINYIIEAQAEKDKIPAIKINNWKYLPVFSYNLTPFGSEYIFNQYFIFENNLLKLNLNLGDNTFHNFYSGGMYFYNLLHWNKISLSSGFQCWHQPKMILGGKTLETTQNNTGFLTKIEGSFFPFNAAKNFGFYTQLGYKTDGYVMGEELKKGIILRFGTSLKLQ